MSDEAPKQEQPERPPLVPQPNGRGALYHGGVPGNKGGGRPRERVRRRMLKMTNESAKQLQALLKNKEKPLSAKELTNIMAAGARFSVGTELEAAIEDGRVRYVAEMPPDLSQADWEARYVKKKNGNGNGNGHKPNGNASRR